MIFIDTDVIPLLYMDSYSQLKQILRGAIESVRIKWVEFIENLRAFFPQGQRKLSVIIRCPKWVSVCKVGFDGTVDRGIFNFTDLGGAGGRGAVNW